MLSISGVTKRYGKTLANDNISFAVGDGQIGILLGPNGAGKSTIIKCITGLLRFTGRIEINGYENTSLEAKAQLRYIPEMPAVYDLLTVEEHLEFIRRAYKVEDEAYSNQLLEPGTDDKRNKLGKELSKGMQQKLSICCALCHKPRVVIFDEPLVGLDPHAIKELKEIFRELKASGASVLISTHMIDSVEDYWDVANIMMNGRFAATKLNDGSEGQTLEELFFAITEGAPASARADAMKSPLVYLTATKLKNQLIAVVKSPAKLIYAVILVALFALTAFSGSAYDLEELRNPQEPVAIMVLFLHHDVFDGGRFLGAVLPTPLCLLCLT